MRCPSKEPPGSRAGLSEQTELAPAQLMHAAKMARLSGLTYRPVDDLTDWLSKEGLQLVARGQTHFTRCCSARSAALCYAQSIAETTRAAGMQREALSQQDI